MANGIPAIVADSGSKAGDLVRSLLRGVWWKHGLSWYNTSVSEIVGVAKLDNRLCRSGLGLAKAAYV